MSAQIGWLFGETLARRKGMNQQAVAHGSRNGHGRCIKRMSPASPIGLFDDFCACRMRRRQGTAAHAV